MKQFLLLRNNKQTGPYSAEELQQMGLKAYDLIWVEGKSAAWRYPGEVEELKSFAPPVEEQPYDRFYKKSEATAKNQSQAEPPALQSQPATVTEKPASKKEKEYKRVFVTLPSNATSPAATAPITPVERPAPVTTEKKPEPQQYQQYQPYVPPEDQYSPEPIIPEPAPAAPAKKQTTPQPKKMAGERETSDEVYFPRKKAFRIKPIPLAAMAIGMVSMIALGIWIGLSLDKKDEGVSLIKNVDQVPAKPNKNDGLIDQTPINNAIPAASDSAMDDREANVPVQTKKTVRIPEPSTINLADSTKKMTANANDDTNDLASKEDVRIKKPAPKITMPELEKMVSVTSNDYKVGPFGGISKLALTVKNSSDYNLNLVVVQVEYLKVNKEVFKTENLYFRDLAANSSLTLEAPRSNRGNTINYKVTLINSKDHLFHAGN
ncbi:MAG TPA: DUF4339 domain-containing protein [Chitinophagaceae bacterium]|nr:DUF4339 domain-containing protein [Chitinophagaceae bacterium]